MIDIDEPAGQRLHQAAGELLAELRGRGFTVRRHGDTVVIAPTQQLTRADRDRVAEHRPALWTILRAEEDQLPGQRGVALSVLSELELTIDRLRYGVRSLTSGGAARRILATVIGIATRADVRLAEMDAALEQFDGKPTAKLRKVVAAS